MPPDYKKIVHPAEFYLKRIADGKPFSSSRYGDGEWRAIFNPGSGRNCDGHAFFPAMGKILARILRDRPAYFLGMQAFGWRQSPAKIHRFLKQNELLDLRWHNSDVLAMHRLSILNRMNAVFKAFSKANVLIVGPAHLRRLKSQKVLNYLDFVEVPRRNAFLKLPEIKARVLKSSSKLPKPLVISISCGLPAGILVHRLYKEIGKDTFLLDMGSVFDPYVGVCSRAYMGAVCKRLKAK